MNFVFCHLAFDAALIQFAIFNINIVAKSRNSTNFPRHLVLRFVCYAETATLVKYMWLGLSNAYFVCLNFVQMSSLISIKLNTFTQINEFDFRAFAFVRLSAGLKLMMILLLRRVQWCVCVVLRLVYKLLNFRKTNAQQLFFCTHLIILQFFT